MAKLFPIQNVSFRGERDNFLTEGGGSKTLPKWVDEATIVANGRRVHGQLGLLSELFADEDRTMPVIAEVTLNKKATAKSYRSAVRGMLDVGSKRNVIGVTSVGKLLVKIDSGDDLNKIEKGFSVDDTAALPKSKKIGLSAIEDISQYRAVVEEDIRPDDFLKLQMVDYLNEEYNHRSRVALDATCNQYGVEVKELNYASGLRLYGLSNVSDEALTAIASMDCVLSVRKMPTIEFEAAPDPENSTIEVMLPQEGTSYPVVGLLDTGVGDIDYLRPWLTGTEDNAADLDEGDVDRRHGTAVAGVINYGDLLENRNLTECGPCKIQSCIVNTSKDRATLYENELVSNIQRAVTAHPEIKIWNLSQGTDKIIVDDRYSDLGIALDSLQKSGRILICKSAGNVDPHAQDLRITDGADSLLSLVVGSVAHKKTTMNDADENDRSPFSRIGPGVENVVKPDLVHYGGNVDTHLSLFSEFGRQFRLWSGTSFAVPRVTSLAANLSQAIGGECNPLLLKALLIHNADYPAGLSKTAEELRVEMGFGLPAVVTDMLANDEDECTLVFAHTLEKGTDIVSLDFPYPQCLVENGEFIGNIKLTLAVNPVVNATQGCEYCQSQADVLLETYDHVEYVQLGEGTMMRNEARTSNDAVNVLNGAFYSAKAFNKEFAEERMLIEQGDKYQPIKKYVVDLSKMTPANKRKALGSSRKWALKINGLYRDAAEQSLLRDGEVLAQDVVVVVTISDPRHQGQVYAECLRLLGERGYVHADIHVSHRLEIDNS